MLLLVACAAVVVSLQQRATARSERATAIARQVAAEADRLRAADPPSSEQDEALAAQLDIAAYRMRPSPQTYTNLVDEATAPLFTEVWTRTKDVPLNYYAPNNGRVGYDSARRVLALVGSDVIWLWDTSRFGHPARVGRALTGWQVAVSPDGQVLAVQDNDGAVSLWNISYLRHPGRLGRLRPPGDATGDFLAFSHDGALLAVGGEDTSLWDVRAPERPQPAVRSLPGDLAALSPRAPLLATLDTADGAVRLWDVSRPRRPARLSVVRVRDANEALLAFSPDGRTLVTGGTEDGNVRLWDTSDPAHAVALQEQISTPDGTRADAVAYSPDGRILAVTGDSGIQLWNVTDRTQPARLGKPLGRRSRGEMGLAFGPDGRSLIADDTHALRVWRLPPTALVVCAAPDLSGFSADGRTMASTCEGGPVRLWDTTDPDAPRPVAGSLPGWAAVFAPHGHILAVASFDGGVRLYDATDPSRPRPLGRMPAADDHGVTAMTFDTDGHTLTAYEEQGPDDTGDPRFRTWDITDPSRPRLLRRSVLMAEEGGATTPTSVRTDA
ncbi:WD40 repeat domain-containing protein [Streptomyces sp. NPDC053086]|uniref:WD40 repeat domain-containing protein n=1 Tax=unclassified Streptomyces TaxID=2593676 RepID=UPI0037D8B7B9